MTGFVNWVLKAKLLGEGSYKQLRQEFEELKNKE